MSTSFLPSPFLILDCSNHCYEGDVAYPFALDETIADKVGAGELPPVVHLWRHRQAFVLGMRDRRLPRAGETMRAFEEEGFSVAVRHSGGAAVPIDAGVLNVSLIAPNPDRKMSFDQDFERMVRLVKGALGEMGDRVDQGEISGSYCPGDYDLSARGKKFCGIAQRRQLTAFIAQAFIVATGSGEARARRARRFYELASAGETKGVVDVRPTAMASLDELFNVSMDRLRRGMISFLTEQGGRRAKKEEINLARMELEIFRKTQELKRRYEPRQ